MKYMRMLSILLALILVGCSNSLQSKAEYRKISSQEAESMMSDYVMVLDVRTQEEFDEGHIENAVLIPDYELREKTESVIIDKNQIVLVYCRTGTRSETASKELIEMGYKNVFDFGGIVDWTGEVVRKSGVNIDYNIYAKIHEDFPEFTFNIRGIRHENYRINERDVGDMIQFDTISVSSADGKYKQELSGMKTWLPYIFDYDEDSGNYYDNCYYDRNILSLDDWNFDGYLDISLLRDYGGAGDWRPYYYWLWDNDQGAFVLNDELTELSNQSTLSINNTNKQIESFRTGRNGYRSLSYYSCDKGKYFLIKDDYSFIETAKTGDKYRHHFKTEELINGKMTVTKDYYVDEAD